MVFVEGNQVIFSAVFLAKHTDQTILHAPLDPGPINFRITFAPPTEDSGLSWTVDPNGLMQITLRPSNGFGSCNETPALIGARPDGSPLSITYSEQRMNQASLIHFFLLKGPTPAPANQ
jgi:hypothetical protein